jgi:DNA polymerase-3 subunit gamma/tau
MAADVPGTAHEDQARRSGPPARLALYRRYRPATFAEVKGQDHVTQPLRQALRNGRVNHAYLFSGPRGCGKTTSARILARSLNCAEGPTPDPCGKCESCIALAPDGPGSLDVIEIDAASHGGVDDARDLRERAFYSPVSGRFKIYIIDEAHMVTREGFNALLKLVEEPPPHLKFVFATTEPEKVLPTIRSRTHHYPFRLVPPGILRELLEEILRAEGIGYEPAVLPLVVRAGAGSARDSLSVLDQLLAGSGEDGLRYDQTVALLGYTDDSLLDEVADAFAAGDGAAVFRAVDRVVEGGHDPRRFAADLLDRFRDLIVLAAVPGAGQTGLLDLPADRLDRMSEQAGRFGQAELARTAQILSEGLIQMRGTTSPRLLLELACAQVLLPGVSTGEKALLARLERLERRLEAAGPGSAGPGTAQPGTAGPGSAGPGTAQPGTAQPRTAGPGTPGPGSAGSGSAGSGSARSGSARSGSARSGSAGSESAGTEAAVPDERRTSHDPYDSRGTPGVHEPDEAPGTSHQPAAPRVASVPEAAARDAPGPATGPPPGGSQASADSVSQRWPEILEAVKRERRVAWMLLSNAVVQSVEDGVLTIRFAREGDVKGFSSSGCDRDLGRVLATAFGLKLQVRSVFGAQVGGAPPSVPPTEPAQPTVRAAPAPADPVRPDPVRPDPVRRDPGRPDPEQSDPGPSDPGRSDPLPSDRGRSDPAPSGPVQSGRARSDPAQSGGAQSGPAQSRPARPGSVRHDPTPADLASDAPATASTEDLTGMDLIKRELGGRVIAEIDET